MKGDMPSNKETKVNLYIYIYIYIGFTSVSLFDGISPFMCYLMPKPSLLKDSSGTI